jgi:tRNA-specific 2-thiouridylase
MQLDAVPTPTFDASIAAAPPERVVVAMSGGVDSSVAALLLQQRALSALGISMQVWDYKRNGGASSRSTCCSPDDFTDARKVAARVGIPYYVFDFEETFREKVIENFVQTYERGETPNPCVDCNSKVKFKELRSRAEALGCSHVATGHYARIRKSERGWHLLRGADSAKDQSYFLYNLSQSELAQTLFPVGDLEKPVVRELARQAGLLTAEKPESQDICFVSGSVGEFVVQIRGKTAPQGGQIVDRQGRILGEHSGVQNFTIGQRKGLRIGGTEEPLYVLAIEPLQRRVVVGARSELEQPGCVVSALNWCSPELASQGPQAEFKALAQLRYRQSAFPVSVRPLSEGKVALHFEQAGAVATPGQAAVLYDLENLEVLGGGRIERGVVGG